MNGLYIERVNGYIVGGQSRPYRFYTLDGKAVTQMAYFDDDEKAIEWFKMAYPAEYKAGAEMRYYGEEK